MYPSQFLWNRIQFNIEISVCILKIYSRPILLVFSNHSKFHQCCQHVSYLAAEFVSFFHNILPPEHYFNLLFIYPFFISKHGNFRSWHGCSSVHHYPPLPPAPHAHTSTRILCVPSHKDIPDTHTSQQTSTLTSNLMLGADRTTQTVLHTKCLECYKHLFRLKRRFCVWVCAYIHACMCASLTGSVHALCFWWTSGKFNCRYRPPDSERSNMTKYLGCVLHKKGQVYVWKELNTSLSHCL